MTHRLLDNTPLMLTSLLIVDSLHFVFAKMLQPYLPPTAAAMYVLLVATGQVVIYMAVWQTIRLDLLWRHIGLFLGVGFLVGGNTALNYVAVSYIDPGTASLLGHTSMLFGMVLGVVWLNDQLSRLEWAGAVVALAGVFIISFQPGDYLRLGALIVLISAFMYALHAALVKRFGRDLTVSDFFLFRLIFTSGFLVLFAAGQNQLVLPSGQGWLVLLMVGTLDVTISRALYYLALQRLTLSLHNIVLTFSPVVTIGWTLLLFGIWPTGQQLIGGLAVIAGLMMVALKQRPVNPPTGVQA